MENKKVSIANTKIKTTIPSYAFINREDLTYITLPESIKSIGERAFAKCKNLKKIILPENLEYIGASAFEGCENLEEITLPPKVKKLNYRTFSDCKRLKRIMIPEGIEELDWAVFAGCENIIEIVLPKSLKKLNKQLFLNCKKLKKIILPPTITSLPDECFKGCIRLNITLNENITRLGNRVFEDCYKLKTFPENVTSFGENCFRNCRNILTVNLNEQIEFLPDGLFDGCTKLLNINSPKKLNIGKKCFRNCKSLTAIPSFVNCLNEQAFENCTGLTKINIINPKVPFACFRGCKNLTEILNQENIYSMGSFAFSGCESLESFNIYNLSIIPAEAFSNCKKLKTIKLRTGVKSIETRAFDNCRHLTEIYLPDTIKTIKKEAFRNCKSLKTITIPANLKTFGDAAFSYMDSLEHINVSPYNKNFMTPDHKILIHVPNLTLVLYACGSQNKSYSLETCNIQFDKLGHKSITAIKKIGEFAFAGAKHLEELTLCGWTKDIEATSFYGCNNLKTLTVKAISPFTWPSFHIKDHGKPYNNQLAKKKSFIPFEKIVFDGELTAIFPNALKHFTNVKKLILPQNKSFYIDSHAFYDCSLLKEVLIPNGVNMINDYAFTTATKVKFSNGLALTGFIKLFCNNEYKGNYKIYVATNNTDHITYYIEENNKITKITKSLIDAVCDKSEAINDNPALFLDFTNDLIRHDLAIKQLLNGILMSTMSLENRTILFAKLKKNDTFFLTALKNSQLLEEKDQNTENLLEKTQFQLVINYIELLRKYHIETPELHHKILMANLDIQVFEQLINFDLELLKKIIIYGNLLEVNNKDDLTYQILQKNTLQPFMKLVKKYDIKDRYLFSKPFIRISKNPLLENMLKVYDANIKRLLKASQTIKNNESTIQNLNDLLILMKITGALEEDKITRQKAATFISEKIFEEKLPNGNSNEFRIIEDDIHRIFNFPYIREEFDQEFAIFFLENYQELLKEERKKSGFIQRIYLNFKQISKTCTSNKGSQRKLKVTIKKCENYLSNNKFDDVTEENKELMKLISEWFDENTTWLNAKKIYQESLTAPRNIFTKVIKNDEENMIYDRDPNHDLKEPINPNFSYHWLPKQDYDNLILGKYCNCCAHVEGVGSGIMRASMILDNCQNLVIRNDLGEIIAKSTLYVNKEQGYAVFNNVESSLNYRDEKSIEKIYFAFLRGTEAFIKAYNANNPEAPITTISIGSTRNTISKLLTTENNHPEIPIQKSLDFDNYALTNYKYNGDWQFKQRLVLKRGIR